MGKAKNSNISACCGMTLEEFIKFCKKAKWVGMKGDDTISDYIDGVILKNIKQLK